ncbi:MAG TPA: DUF2274 domain-containing protein [Novosphingobium sp.]|nr:DUF2274 domain-containing protein [Novosphingobium sp.]
MAGIKLPRLPDRTPVKLTITVSPDLHHMLARYAQFYRETYHQEETVAELVPAMLGAFLRGDKAFAQWCRDAAAPHG